MSRPRVLLMDDEDVVCVVAARTLRQLGFEVDCVADGDEAVRACRRELERGAGYVLALLDLKIPGGKGGLETVRRLREIDPGIKAFVMSGSVDDPAMLDPERHGFAGAIDKPFTYQGMVDALQGALGKLGS